MKKIATVLMVLSVLLIATPVAFAQEAGAAGGATNWGAVAKALAMGFAAAFCGTAQGRATASACESFARNPGAADAIRFALILALVLIESMALYVFAAFFIKII